MKNEASKANPDERKELTLLSSALELQNKNVLPQQQT